MIQPMMEKRMLVLVDNFDISYGRKAGVGVGNSLLTSRRTTRVCCHDKTNINHSRNLELLLDDIGVH